jgi:hypothetical protein
MRSLLIFAILCGCNGGPPAKSQQMSTALHACLTIEACDLHIPTGSVSGCVSILDRPSEQQLPLTLAQIDCLAAAKKDCSAALRCVSDGKTACPAPSSCSGTVLTTCIGSAAWQFDCAVTGLSCVNNGCGRGPCLQDNGDSAYCNGDKLSVCEFQAETVITDCAAYGATCVTAANGSAACSGSCAGFHNRCDGNVEISCAANGQGSGRDCGAFGLACVTSRLSSLEDPCALANDCQPGFQESCAGSKLTICDEGTVTTVDCAAAGFSGCTVEGSFGHCTL